MPADATAPIQLDAAALASAGGPIASALLPGWTITWVACSREEIDQLIPGALAVCRPLQDTTTTRELATIYVVTPWPPGESLAETIKHEVTHAWISPLVALVPDSEAAIQIEEVLVERMGKYLASLGERARGAMEQTIARVLAAAPAIESRGLAARVARARISARAERARGGQMDPKLIAEALDALIAGDAAKCQEILKGIIAASAAGGVASPASEPAMEGAKLGTGGEEPMPENPMEEARTYARKGAEQVETTDQKRARLAIEKIEHEATEAKIAGDIMRESARETLVTQVRARLAGHSGLPAIEKDILAARDIASAKLIADIAIKMGGGPARARSGVEHQAASEAGENGPAPFTAAQLEGEGIPAALAAEIVGQWSIPGVGKRLAEQTLSHARARLFGHSSPYLPKEPTHKGANGAGRSS